jgi:hypothetical protein
MKNPKNPEHGEFLWTVDFDIFPPMDAYIIPEAKKHYRGMLEKFIWVLHQTGYLVSEKRDDCKPIKFYIDLEDSQTLKSFNQFHLLSNGKLTLQQECKWLLRIYDSSNPEWCEILMFDCGSRSFYFEGLRRCWEVTKSHSNTLRQEIVRISRELGGT